MIEEELTRIINARNTLRTKAVSLGIGTANDKIDVLATEYNNIQYNAPVAVEVQADETYTIPQGYHTGTGTVTGVGGGGGAPGVGDYTVTVYDYDGTVLLEKKGNAGDTITLPTAPTHDRLTFQEWSSSSALNSDGQSVTIANSDIAIGATYTTTSGNTEIDIVLTKTTSLTLTFQNLTGMTSINWGDGTTNSELSHTYTNYGNYTIQLIGVTDFTGSIFDPQTTFEYSVVAARLSSNITQLNGAIFSDCPYLTTITIPNTVTYFEGRLFGADSFIKCVIFPNGTTTIGGQICYYCYSLKVVVIPSTVTTIGRQAFMNTYNLRSIIIPGNINNLESYCFQTTNILFFDFRSSTSIPTLGPTVFVGFPYLAQIVVPDNLYDSWIAATNWTTYADYIYKASEVNL